jgi:hypothetical protein
MYQSNEAGIRSSLLLGHGQGPWPAPLSLSSLNPNCHHMLEAYVMGLLGLGWQYSPLVL